MNRDVMIAATLIVAGVPDATIRFLLSVYDYMEEDKEGFNCADLAQRSDYTSESARQHVTVLTEYEFLNRTGYRSWILESSKFIGLGDTSRHG